MKQMQKEYKTIDFPPLTEDQKKELDMLNNMPDSKIDLSDIPETDFSNGHFYYIQSPKMSKTSIHTKIDNDNLAWLKKGGKGYQARLNNVIRWARLHDCPIGQM